jgi:hypothetical protein
MKLSFDIVDGSPPEDFDVEVGEVEVGAGAEPLPHGAAEPLHPEK